MISKAFRVTKKKSEVFFLFFFYSITGQSFIAFQGIKYDTSVELNKMLLMSIDVITLEAPTIYCRSTEHLYEVTNCA